MLLLFSSVGSLYTPPTVQLHTFYKEMLFCYVAYYECNKPIRKLKLHFNKIIYTEVQRQYMPADASVFSNNIVYDSKLYSDIVL